MPQRKLSGEVKHWSCTYNRPPSQFEDEKGKRNISIIRIIRDCIQVHWLRLFCCTIHYEIAAEARDLAIVEITLPSWKTSSLWYLQHMHATTNLRKQSIAQLWTRFAWLSKYLWRWEKAGRYLQVYVFNNNTARFFWQSKYLWNGRVLNPKVCLRTKKLQEITP